MPFAPTHSYCQATPPPQVLPPPRAPECALSGRVFVQQGGVGVASYHFPAVGGLKGAYISYEAAPKEWKLDNGQRPPNQKAFLNPTFDVKSRTFRGTIEWKESAWRGDARWEYTMVFADSFSHIASGSIMKYDASGSQTGKWVYGVDLQYKLHH